MSFLEKNACLAAGAMCSVILVTKWRGFIRQLGNLGRIVLQGRPDGRTHVTCEVAGDEDDPMTEKRAAMFKPLGMALARQLDRATGGTGEERWVSPPPRPCPSVSRRRR